MASKQNTFINTLADLSLEWQRLPHHGYQGFKEVRGHQRFGQYVMNTGRLDLPNPWPELFYAETYRVAYALLYLHGLQIND